MNARIKKLTVAMLSALVISTSANAVVVEVAPHPVIEPIVRSAPIVARPVIEEPVRPVYVPVTANAVKSTATTVESKHDWECIENCSWISSHENTQRLWLPEGWLVKQEHSHGISITFIPDPKHLWKP